MSEQTVIRKPLISNIKENGAVINSPRIYFVFMLLFVLSTDSFWTYTWENRLPYNIINIAIVFMAVACAIVIFVNGKDIAVKRLAAVLTAFVGVSICMIARTEFSLGYIHKLAYPLMGVFLSMALDLKKFARAFVHVMMFLAVWSLVLYLLAQFKLEEYLPIVKNIGGLELHNGIFGFIAVHGDFLVRNWGVFWEPGAFQAYLCLALIFDLFLLKDNKPIVMTVLSLTIVTTLSTTGIISLGMILLLYFISVKDRECLLNKKVLIVAAIVVIAALLLSEKLQNMIFSKLDFDDINESSSFGARYYSIIGNLKIAFKEGLFFGTGVENYNAIYVNTLSGMGYTKDMSNTNTILCDLVRFGWLVGIVEILMVIKFSKKLGQNKLQRIGIALIIFIILFMENFSYSLFWMSVLYFGCDVFGRGKTNENNVSV